MGIYLKESDVVHYIVKTCSECDWYEEGNTIPHGYCREPSIQEGVISFQEACEFYEETTKQEPVEVEK
jgi:hypothetical protein